MRAIIKRSILSRKKQKRPTYPESKLQVDRLRSISQWLFIVPIVMLVLFACGQLGILTSSKIAEAKTQSQIDANYGPWSYVLIHSINSEIIDELREDQSVGDGVVAVIPDTSEGDATWIDLTPYSENHSGTAPHANEPTPWNNSPTAPSTPLEPQPTPSVKATSTSPLPTEELTTPSTTTPIPTATDETPPPTPTRSSSSDPDCGAIVVSNVGFDKDSFNITIENIDPQWEAALRYVDLVWPVDGESGFDAFSMGDDSPERFYDPASPIYTSPIHAPLDPERPLTDGMGTQTIQSIFHQLPEGAYQLTLTFSYWHTEFLCEIVVHGNNSPPSIDPVTFWMAGSSVFGGNQLIREQPNGPAQNAMIFTEFKTAPFADETPLQSGQVTVYFYATNSSDNSDTVGFILKPTIGIPILGTGSIKIPANTSHPTLFSASFHTSAYKFSEGNRLVLALTTENTTKIYWDGEWNASRVILPPMSD
jgi:hypothetical protein